MKSSTPEKNIFKIFFFIIKKIFLITVAVLTYWQLYEYVSEKPEINISIENSKLINNTYKTSISVENGSQSISSREIINDILIEFTDSIRQVVVLKSKVKPKLQFNKKNVTIHLDLFNKNEKFKFFIFTTKRPKINSINYRIKDITQINSYDYINKPKPLKRILNIWIILIVLSTILFIDALLVVTKDWELQKIKWYIHDFPLSRKNKKKFLKGYKKLYGKYRVRLKPNKKFMTSIIKNLFLTFPLKTKEDIEFIKFMANLKTELFILYRQRTSFLIISPIVFIISTTALFINYFYYEIDLLNNNFSISAINQFILKIILSLTILIIIFPRKTMNFVFLKKDAKIKF